LEIRLRDYQQNIIDQLTDSVNDYKKILIVSPCGSGKTVIGKTIIENYNGHVWFVVHRKELVDQAVEEFKDLTNVEVLMIQSIHKHTTKPDLIIIDDYNNTDKYKGLTVKSILTFPEMVKCYRIITGACEFGVRDFLSRKMPVTNPEYSIGEIIKATEGEYGSHTFANFFGMSK